MGGWVGRVSKVQRRNYIASIDLRTNVLLMLIFQNPLDKFHEWNGLDIRTKDSWSVPCKEKVGILHSIIYFQSSYPSTCFSREHRLLHQMTSAQMLGPSITLFHLEQVTHFLVSSFSSYVK